MKRVSALTTSTVSRPSLMASGICVMAKMPPNEQRHEAAGRVGKARPVAAGRQVGSQVAQAGGGEDTASGRPSGSRRNRPRRRQRADDGHRERLAPSV